MRVHQYLKNGFIFLPLFFAGNVTELGQVVDLLWVALAFSFVASAVYIFNDMLDLEADRIHPTKCKRPLAAGQVSRRAGVVLMTALSVSGIVMAFYQSLEAFFYFVLYLALQLLYNLRLKHIGIIDVTCVALGFVIRLYIGKAVSEVYLSDWLIIMTFLLALFLALAKRRDDLLIFERSGDIMRQVVTSYNLRFLDHALVLMGGVVIVAYINYCTSPQIIAKLDGQSLLPTAFFVVFGILRYLQITYVVEDSSSPTKIILKDKFMMYCVLGWFGLFLYILYLS